jgi:signal transduction histidine kinase
MRSIRRRLTRELLLVALVLLGGGWVAFFLAARTELIEQFDATLRARAVTITTLAVRDEGHLHLEAADRLAQEFSRVRPREFFEIWDAAGTPLLRSDSLEGADLNPPPAAPNHRVVWNLALPSGNRGRALALYFQPRLDGDHPGTNPQDGEVRLAVAGTREGLDEALTELLAIAAAGGAALFVAIGWGVPRILRRGLRPLDDLARQVSGIGADSLALRLEVAGLPAELLPIAARLNDLLARLESSFERERRFSADLAHELRTPIAELRSLAECALKWPEAREPTTDRDVLASARHMETLVTQLLALARGEQGQVQATLADTRLDEAVKEAWAPFAGRAGARSLRLRLDLAAVSAAVDPFLLRSILNNLFDNAVDYAPEGGEIQVSLEAGPAGVRLRLANSVEAFEASDVSLLFDRFWRKETARSGQQHLGLGLPLARTYAAAMGWSLSAALEPLPSRLVFTLANSR